MPRMNCDPNSAYAFGYNGDGQVTSVTSTADYNQLSGPRTDMLTGAFSYETANRLTGLAYTSNGGPNTIDTLGCLSHFSNLRGLRDHGP